MCLQICIQISLKLWPVDVAEKDADRINKNKQTDFAMSRPNRKSDRPHPYTIG